MSEAESPDLLGGGHRVSTEDVRALTGAVTPHFALQVRNRVRRLIEDLPPDDPTRIFGEGKIVELEELAQHSGEPRGSAATEALGRE